MLRWRAKSQAIAVPPIHVIGTSTGFGQWSGEAWQEDYCRALGSEPQIVCAPAERFRSVPMENKTGPEPHRKNNPGMPHRSLKLPDVPADKSAERENLD